MAQELPTSSDEGVEKAARKTVRDEAQREAEAELTAQVVAEADLELDATAEAESKTGSQSSESEERIDLASVIDELAESSRLRRQDAAKKIREYAERHPDELKGYVNELVDALERPEAQTRWQVLDTLIKVGADDAELVSGGFEGAENALFEEGAGSSFVRLSAFRYLVVLGKSSPERSDEVWPLLSEAAQVYHGMPEYREMLLALLEFAGGNISETSKKAVADRVRFDAQGKTNGFIKTYSAQILDVVEPQSPKDAKSDVDSEEGSEKANE